MPTERIYERRKGIERRELTPHQQYLEDRLRRFFIRCLAIVAALGLICAASLAGFTVLLREQHNITSDIQRARYDSLLTSCNEQNSKNLAVNTEIDKAIQQLPPKRRELADKKSKPFRLILNASVPLTLDCFAYAQNRTEGNP